MNKTGMRESKTARIGGCVSIGESEMDSGNLRSGDEVGVTVEEAIEAGVGLAFVGVALMTGVGVI